MPETEPVKKDTKVTPSSSTPPSTTAPPSDLVDPLEAFDRQRKAQLQGELDTLASPKAFRQGDDGERTIRPSARSFGKAMLEQHLRDTGRIGDGGPDQDRRNLYSEHILHGMENAVNEEKLRKGGVAKGFSTEDIDKGIGRKGWHHVADSIGVDSNWAHFVGRHGAPEVSLDPVQQEKNNVKAKGEQVSRVLAGHNPDEAPSTGGTTTVQIGGKDTVVPLHTTTGSDTGKNSGGFSSHNAQLFAIEEAYAQGWNRRTGGANGISHTDTMTNTFDKTTKGTKAKGKKGSKGYVPGTPDVKTSESETVTLTGGQRIQADVTLPKAKTGGKAPFEGGFGSSYSAPTKVTAGPLTETDLQNRATTVTEVDNEQGATVILDEDARGGFTVQTAYPTDDLTGGARTKSELSTSYRGTGTKAETVNGGTSTKTTKNLQKKDVVLPEVVGSGLSDEDQLKQSLSRIPPTKK